MLTVKRNKISEFDRELVAFKDSEEVAKTCYSIAITRTKMDLSMEAEGAFYAESKIEDELKKKFPGEKIFYDY